MALCEKTLPTAKGFALQQGFPGRPVGARRTIGADALAARHANGFGILGGDESLA
jgi:hypothetical protein